MQIRCPVPPGSELSTPGSGGYDSPSVLFAIEPSSLMRSSMQNPLFVDRYGFLQNGACEIGGVAACKRPEA